MRKIAVVSTIFFMLGGCVPTLPTLEQSSPSLAAGAFDFNWRLSGERAIAPVQVFNNQQQVWLQFRPEQHLPAIFAYQRGQYHAVKYQHFEPYVVIEGQWRELLFQGGRLQAQARHESVQQPQITEMPPRVPKQAQTKTPSHPKHPKPLVVQDEPSTSDRNAQTAAGGDPVQKAEKPAQPSQALPKETRALSAPAQSTQRFEIGPADETMRQALQRWAKQANWHFTNEHWGLEVDYPIMNTAQFQGPFEQSVEQLLKSAQLGAQPLRACFYSNQVLRIIPEPQSCLAGGHGVEDRETPADRKQGID